MAEKGLPFGPLLLDAFRLLVQAGEEGVPAGEIAARPGARRETLEPYRLEAHAA